MSFHPKPKVIILLILYMFCVYTFTHAITITNHQVFVMGGGHADLFEKGEVEYTVFDDAVVVSNNKSMSVSDRWDYMNNTYGKYIGKHLTANWLDTGYYYCWEDLTTGYQTKLIDWKFEKYLVGTLSSSDLSYQEGFGKMLGTVYGGVGFITGLLTFNIIGSSFVDGSETPELLKFLPALMVFIPWIYILLWLLPYAIEILKALAAALGGIL